MTARLATMTTTRPATSGTVETCRLTRSWNKALGKPRWLLATNDPAEPSLHIDLAYEGALAVEEQLRAAAKVYFVDIDELRQGNVRDIPLICDWQTERRGLDDVRVCTRVRPIDRNFPAWGIADPDKFNLLLSEFNVGAALYNETLGYDRRRWPAYEECKRRMQDKLAVKPENIIPFKPHKDIPDAATNPDWSVALRKVANMGMEAVADKTTLNEAFPRDENGEPIDKPAHETNPDKVPFAVTNHIKRETGITGGVGTFIARLFPDGLDADKVRELGADSVWATVEAAVADFNAKKGKPAEPPAPAAAANGKTQQPASTPLETAKSGSQVSTTTPPTKNAPERPVEAKETIVPAAPEIVVPSQSTAIIPFDPTRAIAQAKMYADTVRVLRSDGVLKEGKDYGKIPGAGDKATLFKAGAEKLCNAFGFCPRFVLIDKVINWSPSGPLFYFQYECQLVNIETGKVVATGIGSCNSMESKYRYRWLWKNQLDDLGIKPDGLVTRKTKSNQTQYRVDNDDVFSQVNTLDKMAQKRALVAATLIGANASEHFTQDIEDLPDFGYIDAEIA